jgi:single-stranded DNA-specific DHH superfamily exonuclease
MSNLEQISNELKMIEPFGKGIGKPVFCIERVRITRIRETANKSHIMLFIAGELGDGNIKAILFNVNSKLQIVGEINKNKDALFDIVGYVNFHEKYGASFIIEDIRVKVF